jgi:hypothetical protein
MIILNFLALTSATFLIGLFLLNFFDQLSITEKIAGSFLVGSAWLTFLIFLVCCVWEVPFSSITVVAMIAGSLVSFGLLQILNGKLLKENFILFIKRMRTFSKFPTIDKLLIIILGILLLYSFVQNWIWPITDWDAIAFYDFRGKFLAASGSMQAARELGYFFGYPPYTSFLHAMSYSLGIPQAKLWYSIIYGSFLLFFYAFFRKELTRTRSLIGTLLVALQPLIFEHSTVAYTNLSYITFFVLGILCLWHWVKNKKWNYLVLGSLLVATSTWVRSAEPFWLVGILIIVVGIVKDWRKNWMAIFSVGIIFVIKSFWPRYIAQIESQKTAAISANNSPIPVEKNVAQPIAHSILQKIFIIFPGLTPFVSYFHALTSSPTVLLSHIFQVIIYTKESILPVFIFLVIPAFFAIWSDFKKGRRMALFQWMTIGVLIAMILAGTLIFSFTFETWDQIGGSAARMSMFLPPLIIFVLMSNSLWQLHPRK